MSKLVVTIAGDSGDGVQLLGGLFTDNIAIQNFDLNTLPDFPAEIRAPAGTIHGVSGFQIQYGSEEILTAGNKSDVFIALNAAAFKKYSTTLKPTGVLIYDPSGFDAKNCKLAGFDLEEIERLENRKISIEFAKLTRECLSDFDITDKEKDKNKNIFALGVISFAVHSSEEMTANLISQKFKGDKLDQLKKVLHTGFYYAETIEFSIDSIENKSEKPAKAQSNITGNKAIALAIKDAPKIFGRNVLFAGYPITPASEILHELAKEQSETLIVKQAEDEISAAGMALGAAFGGNIGITASSGPGIDLKQETIGLALMAEIPILIVDVQRAGPSTGMPTKIEQSDLNAALYGRHGDTPVPIVAIKSPSTAYETTIQAIEIMIRFQTPVFLLSDALIANGSELWNYPVLKEIKIEGKEDTNPYSRDEYQVRPWVRLGESGTNYIAGGLEKDIQTGGISYDGENHQKMTNLRAEKIQNITKYISKSTLEIESSQTGSLIVSWGSTYGAVREAFLSILSEKKDLAHIHLDWILPLPSQFLDIVNQYDQIIVPELNSGQLADYISKFIDKKIHKINKVKGAPFFETELKTEILKYLD